MGKQSQPGHRLKHQSARSKPTPDISSVLEQKKIGFGSHIGLLIVLFVFLILATFHSLIVPITQGEDELAHYRYISFIAQMGRLPIDHVERQLAWYRSDWPPLYHLLVGWVVSPLDTTRPHLKDVGDSPRRRLVGEIFYPRLIIYTEDANWPWQDGILAWHLGRFISIIFSAGALVFTYLSTLEMCRGAKEKSPLPSCFSAPLLALAVTGLLAFIPRFLFTSAMLGDDSLFVFLSAVFIWLLLRVVRGDDRWWLYAVVGLVLGLSIVTKYSTGLLPVVIIPVVVWRARQAHWSWGWATGRVALTWLFTLIGASWWFVWIGYYFNSTKEDGLIFGLLKPLLTAGPDVSMRRIFAVFGGGEFTGQERPAAIAAGTFGDWTTYLFQTFWGVPVLEHDPLFPWAYIGVLVFCLVALIGLWWLWRAAQSELRFTLGILTLIAVLLFPFPILRFFLTHNVFETGQGRHILFPAAQAIPIMLVLGWLQFSEWVRRPKPSQPIDEPANGKSPGITAKSLSETPYSARHTLHPSPFLLFTPIALLLLWSIFQLFYMAANYPDPLPVRTTTFDPAEIPQPLKHNFGDDIQLLGYDFVPDADQSVINLTLFWRSLKMVNENYRTQVQLVDTAGRPHFTWLSHPLNGRYPTRAWDEGDVIQDTLPLPLAAVPPDTYSLQLNLLHEAEDTPVAGRRDDQGSEPFQFIQIPLTSKPSIVKAANLDGIIDYRLWVDDAPARYRQTLPLSWTYHNPESQTSHPTWALIGPDQIPRAPVAQADATIIFIVGADWPSGAYRLQAEDSTGSHETEPLVTVANEARLFDLPSLPAGWVSVEANFANQVKLLGYTLPTRRVEPGGELPLTLYWQSLAPVLPELLTYAVLLNADQQSYGHVDRYPSGFYSPILWAFNEVVMDSFVVPIQADAPPGVYFLHVGQYELSNGQPNSLALVEAGRLVDATAVVIGPIKVGGPPPGVTVAKPEPQVPLNQSFGDQITLLGYDLDQTAVARGQLSIKLYWRAEVNPAADYTTFLHLRNVTNETVTQKDSPPVAGSYPTSLWDPGEIVVDEITLPLARLSPGEYIPVIGLYELATGTRLIIPGQTDNELPLAPIQIKE